MEGAVTRNGWRGCLRKQSVECWSLLLFCVNSVKEDPRSASALRANTDRVRNLRGFSGETTSLLLQRVYPGSQRPAFTEVRSCFLFWFIQDLCVWTFRSWSRWKCQCALVTHTETRSSAPHEFGSESLWICFCCVDTCCDGVTSHNVPQNVRELYTDAQQQKYRKNNKTKNDYAQFFFFKRNLLKTVIFLASDICFSRIPFFKLYQVNFIG